MNLSLCVLLCNFLVLSTFTVVTGENVSTKKNVPKKSNKEDIYIDDEDLDGSGNGEDKYDLESSGSGFGPDDEDARTGPISGSKNERKITHLTIPPKSEKEEPTLPMPPPKPQSPPPPPPEPPVSPIVDTFTKTYTTEPEVRKLPPPEEKHPSDTFANNGDKTQTEDTNRNENSVYITNNHDRDRTTSFFAQPGILAAVIGGAVVGLLCAILVVMFIVYRMRKKDEGSYALEEMKRCPATNPYMKPNHREFFA